MNMIAAFEEFAGQLEARFQKLEKKAAGLEQQVLNLSRQLDEWLDTEQALKILGISRSTLLVQRSKTPQPGKVLFRKEGTKCLYSRQSCLDYSRHSADAGYTGLRLAS